MPRTRLAEIAQVSRTVQEYLTELEQQNPVSDHDARAIAQEKVSTTDPDAAWAIKGLPARLGYYDNYLVDTASRVILAVEGHLPASVKNRWLRDGCWNKWRGMEFSHKT